MPTVGMPPMRKVDLFVRLQKSLQNSSTGTSRDQLKQVLLLLEMERFSIDKASLILDEPLENLWRLVNSETYSTERDSYAKRLIG